MDFQTRSATNRLMPVVTLVVYGILFVCLPTPPSHAEDLSGQVRSQFEQHCFDCHGNGNEEGGFNFEKLVSGEYADFTQSKWEAVWKNVRAQTMPPAEAETPSPEVRSKWIHWIQSDIFRLDPRRIDPGHSVLRRLNRSEYKETIKQLTDVDYDVREEFPADDTGYGFDTIGEVLTLSPVLLEKYLAAAADIVSKCTPMDGPTPQEQVHWRNQWKLNTVDGPEPGSLSFAEKGVLHLRRDIAIANSYRLEVEWSLENGWVATAQEGMVQLSLVDNEGKPRMLREQKVSFLAGQRGSMSTEVDLPKGTMHLQLEFIPTNSDATVTSEPSKQQPYRFSLSRSILVGPLQGGELEYREKYRRIFFNGPPPNDPITRRDHLKSLLRRFADQAYRRPIDEPTLDRLCDIALQVAEEPGSRYERGVGAALQLILASPRFLFRTEQVSGSEPEKSSDANQAIANDLAVPLDDYSLASRLSYLLWGGPPDQELYQVAASGKLHVQLEQQFDRMIGQEWRLERGIENFVGQWLQTRDVHESQADIRTILGIDSFEEAERTFDWQVREAMAQETRRLYQYFLTNDRPVEELLNAKYTFLNERLAKFYGIEGVQGDSMRKVDLPAGSHRRGLLTHGSLLVVTSNPTRTSPVKRGLFVLENILGTPAPPAPPNVPDLEESKSGKLEKASLREILEFHRRDAACAACHQRMDPLGLAMENYNAIGQWRDTERSVAKGQNQRDADQRDSVKQPIDASGKLMSGESFSGAEELAEILAANRKEDFYRCLTEKIMTFGLGRGMTYRDTTAIDQIIARTQKEDGKMKSLYKAIITSVPFTHRRKDIAEPTLASQP
jgi:mono/diheme cytochrome c family protein